MSFILSVLLIWILIGFILFMIIDTLNLITNCTNITVEEYIGGFIHEYLKKPKFLLATLILWPLLLGLYSDVFYKFRMRKHD